MNCSNICITQSILDQVLRVLDYSRTGRHVLATAGDDGSVHLWDTTGRNPKVCISYMFSYYSRESHILAILSLLLCNYNFDASGTFLLVTQIVMLFLSCLRTRLKMVQYY